MRSGRLCVTALAIALVAPATAEAGGLSFVWPGRPVFEAAHGETNDLAVDFGNQRLTFVDSGAPLTLLSPPGETGWPSCSLVDNGATCQGFHAADAYLGDGDDRARVVVPTSARVWGGAGDDSILASGGGSSADAYGEDDRIYATTPALDGTISGGNGADQIFMQGESAYPRPGRWTVDAGNGDDTMSGGPAADTIDAGPGADTIDVRARGADKVTCGNGRDTVYADESDEIAADCELRLP